MEELSARSSCQVYHEHIFVFFPQAGCGRTMGAHENEEQTQLTCGHKCSRLFQRLLVLRSPLIRPRFLATSWQEVHHSPPMLNKSAKPRLGTCNSRRRSRWYSSPPFKFAQNRQHTLPPLCLLATKWWPSRVG